MSWPEVQISDWDDFQSVVEGFANFKTDGVSCPYLFRGQSDSKWGLRPSLARVLVDSRREDALVVEKKGLAEFRAQAILHLHPNLLRSLDPKDLPGWWSLMQHYSAPTRLLDWSSSPYVAAYFAVHDVSLAEGAVWVFHYPKLEDDMQKVEGFNKFYEISPYQHDGYFQSIDCPKQLITFVRLELTERMIVQQGLFTVSRDPLSDHAEAIEETIGEAPNLSRGYYVKLIIPSKLKLSFLRRLRTLNISANSLFPGLDGVGRSVYELARLHETAPLLPLMPIDWHLGPGHRGRQITSRSYINQTVPEFASPQFPVTVLENGGGEIIIVDNSQESIDEKEDNVI